MGEGGERGERRRPRSNNDRPAVFRGRQPFSFLALQVVFCAGRPQRKLQRKRGNGQNSKPPGKKQMQGEKDAQRGRRPGGVRVGGGRRARWDGCRFLTASTASTASKRIEGVDSPPFGLDQESWSKHAKEGHAPALCTSAVQRQVSRLGRHVRMTSRRGWQQPCPLLAGWFLVWPLLRGPS